MTAQRSHENDKNLILKNTMFKKILISSLVVSSLAVGFVALADTNVNVGANANITTMPPVHAPEMMLQVGPKGNATLRGTVKTVGSNSLTVTSWGGDWTVNVSTGTEVMPDNGSKDAVSDLTQFKTGDFVGVQGMVNSSSSWTIDAKIVRDWTQQPTGMMQGKIKNMMENKGMMKARNYKGAVSNVTATSFTLTYGNTTLTVNFGSTTKLMNKSRSTITAADIQNGDMVRVYGPNTSGTVAATIISDTSIPRTTTP